MADSTKKVTTKKVTTKDERKDSAPVDVFDAVVAAINKAQARK